MSEKGSRHLPRAMARIADVLLNLAFLPRSSWIAKLRLKDVVAGHRQKARIYIARLASANPVHGCLHVIVDAVIGDTLKHAESMPMGVKQHPLTGSAFPQEMSREGRGSANK